MYSVQEGLEFPEGLGERGGLLEKIPSVGEGLDIFLNCTSMEIVDGNCQFMILPSRTSLALVLGRAVHMILINATRRLEIVTISEIQNQQFHYDHKHMHTCASFSN